MDRKGFTLTELMVVMVILVILTTMTVYAVNFTLDSERTRSAARQVQSYLEGARDRAIYESSINGEERTVGVRFLLDPNIVNGGGYHVTSSSMVFVEEITPPPSGSLLVTDSGSPNTSIATQTDGDITWQRLRVRGLLGSGVSIRIPDDGFWYVIQSLQEIPGATLNDPPTTEITFAPRFKTFPPPNTELTFQLRLPPVVRPNQEPMLLPRGIVIDLDRSKLPPHWKRMGGYRNQLDVMFSPRGTVAGKTAAGGLIHLYLSEASDVERLSSASLFGIPSDEPYGTDEDPIGDRLLVTLFPQTGAISSHPVDATDADNNKLADDPFRYAETGEVAAE